MVAKFFIKLLNNIFSNIRSKSLLLEIYFIKEKSDISWSEVGSGYVLTDPRNGS